MNDEQLEQLLRQLFQADKLNVDVTDEEIDEWLANSTPIELSEDFNRRAIEAIQDALRRRGDTPKNW